jgi:hypothetical protein
MIINEKLRNVKFYKFDKNCKVYILLWSSKKKINTKLLHKMKKW